MHRQFSHRVKGLSTSTFKPEEIKALEAGGNRIGAYTYLAKWSPSDLQKPTDRNTGKIRDWIDAVYVKKRFYSAEAAASAAMHSPPPSQSHLPRRSISSNASSAGDDVPVMSMAGLLGDVKLKVDPNHIVSNAPNGLNLRATSTASSHSHDSPAPNHVTAQLFNILDEPLAESAAAPQLQTAAPSAGWDAFADPADSTPGPSAPQSMSWSAFDNGTPTPAVPVLTSHHQLPPQQQQQQQPDMSAAWAAFGEDNSQPQAQPSQQAQQGQQQVAQQQQQRAAEPAPQPPKPAPRQELPLDLFGDGLLSSYAAPPSIAGMYGQPARPAFQYGQAGAYQHQPASFQQQSGPYQQPQPSRPPGLPHGMSFNGYGQGPPAGMPPTGPSAAFDGPVRQRSHSDSTGTGEASAHDPFSGLAPGLGGALPSMPPSRQTSVSSTHSGQDMPGRTAYSSNHGLSQSFGGQQAQPYGGQQAQPYGGQQTGSSIQLNDPFAGSSNVSPAQNQYSAPPTASRPPPKSSGNPFA